MTNNIKCAESYESYGDYFNAIRNIVSEYGDLSTDSVMSAWARATTATNPFMQNSRVKRISTFPHDYGKEEIVKMLKAPSSYERQLRSVARGLEWTAYPYRKIRTTYQAVNTYRYYHYPAYLDSEEAKGKEVVREGRLLDKLNHALKPNQWARQIVGQVIQEGKVAYVPRYEIDKAHNQVGYAFMQQLPTDWFKIVGFNSESKYTIMFDMMYFLSVVGADFRQYGDLFMPFVDDFASVLELVGTSEPPKGTGKKFVYASKNSIKGADGRQWKVNMKKFASIKDNAKGNPQLYNQNGRWAYWVTLPVDKAWVFEVDDTEREVISPLTGLFISFDQIAAVEDVALAVMQNPLVSIGFGEIPYYSDRETNTADPIKLSPAGRATYLAYWAQMLNMANAGGIAFYPAPFSNMHLETLPEATGSSDMTTKEYGYAVLKSGMSGLIPINADPRAGAVNISAKIEEAYCACVYQQMENMMESIYRQIGTKFEWRFKMFGGFVSEDLELDNARKGMQIGMLSETFKYLAIRGISLWEDMGISHLINESGILNLRIPPQTSFTTTSSQQQTTGSNAPTEEGGRPIKSVEETVTEKSESNESSMDT